VPSSGVLAPPDRPLARQTFTLQTVDLYCRLVLTACTSLQAASRVIQVVSEQFSLALESPHPTTGRLWLLRLGYYKLHRPKTPADDWIWLVDHVIQIGTEKCLMIVGVRLCQLPPPGVPLRLEDLEPIAILPVTESNQEVVHQQLEETAEKIGVPRAIVEDQGSDLLAGVNRFCAAHPQTSQLLDMAHKAARLLKARLERDSRWSTFSTQAGQTKFQTQQTELAFLVPPSQRSKARYMNLGPLLNWAGKTLDVLDRRPSEVLAYCTESRLEEKFGWLRDYRGALCEWEEYQTLLGAAVEYLRRWGYREGIAEELAVRLRPLVRSACGEALQEELVSFVTVESRAARPGERLPASTEILESSFGKWKSLEGEHQRGGFTSLILGYAALLSQTTREVIATAIEATPVKAVHRWCQQNLGKTVRSKRVAAYRAVAKTPEAQENRDELAPGKEQIFK
jgi:hypothetical protein